MKMKVMMNMKMKMMMRMMMIKDDDDEDDDDHDDLTTCSNKNFLKYRNEHPTSSITSCLSLPILHPFDTLPI